MGAIADLPIPQGGAIAALPVPGAEQGTPSAESTDIEGTQSSSPEFAKGLRSSVNSTFAAVNALAAASGSAMGLDDFAKDRMAAAQQDVDFSNAVGPRVRNVQDVHGLGDAVDFVAGLAGETAGALAPMALAGAGGLAAGGLRGAGIAAAGSMFPVQTGQQVLRTKDAPGTLGSKLPMAALVGAGQTAAGLAVPLGGAGRIASGAAGEALAEGAGATLAMGGVGAGMEKMAQMGHTAVDPNRDTSGDNMALVNAGVGGLAAGLPIGMGLAAGRALTRGAPAPFDAGRVHTPDEVDSALGVQKRPLDDAATPPDSVPNDPEAIGAWLDQHQAATADDRLRWQAKVPWGKDYDLGDPAQADAFSDRLRQHVTDTVDRPEVAAQVDSLRQQAPAPAPAPGEKPSMQRTALDLSVMDNVLSHLPKEKLDLLSPAQRVGLADSVKHYVMYNWGSEADKLQGQSGMRLPNALPDLFGDQLQPLLESTHKLLGKGGVPLAKVTGLKAGIARATQARASTLSDLEQTVQGSLRPEHLVDPATRDQVTKAVTGNLRDALDSPPSTREDWGRLNDQLDYAFGDNADHVLGEFEKQRARVTQGWESMDKPAAPEGSEGEPPREDASDPYQDKRLGVPIDEADLPHVYRALREEYDPKAVQFKAEPVLDNEGNMTGKQTIHAVDAEAPAGFSPDAMERIKDRSGKAGLENSVISVVRKDGEDGRNQTNAVSLPNLAAETARTMKFAGKPEGAGYVGAVVKEGLSRLMSDPDFVRFGKGSADDMKAGWQIPDEAKVGKFGGKMWTWGDVREAHSEGVRAEARDYWKGMVDDLNGRVAEARKGAGLSRKQALPEGTYEGKFEQLRKAAMDGADGAKEAYNGFVREHARGIEEGKTLGKDEDAPRVEKVAAGENRYRYRYNESDKGMISTDEPIQRALADGEPEHGHYAEGAGRGPAGELATGVRAEDKAPGPVTKPTLSEARVGKEPMDEATKAAVREHVAKVLGPKAKVLFKEMDHAGSFVKGLDGSETLTVALRAIDPRSVGHHESLHGVIARMAETDPRAANVLKEAAGSPTTVAQLRRLLADEPAALKQLDDPEERAAYMYQFWANDKLRLGPRTEGVFNKIKAMLAAAAHALLGVGDDPTTMRQADQILQAFHNGELADRSAAGRVLDRIAPPDQMQGHWIGRMADRAERTFESADGYVRGMKIPAFTAAADKLFRHEGGKIGFRDAHRGAYYRFLNRSNDAVKGMGAEAQARVMNALDSGDASGLSPAERAAADTLKGLLKEVHGYAVDKGVKALEWSDSAKGYVEHDMGEVKNYFPRSYDRDAIRSDMGGFAALLKKHGVEDPAKTIDKMLSNGKVSPDESDFTAGLSYFAPSTLMRTLDIPREELAPYLRKDLAGTMSSYLNHMTRRAEWAERFGNQSQGIDAATAEGKAQGATPEQLRGFADYVKAHDGSLGSDLDPKIRQFMSGVMTYQHYRLLPLALMSNLIDPLGIALRGGGVDHAFKAFARGVRDLVSTNNDEGRQFALSVGAVTDASEAHTTSEQYNITGSSGFLKRANDLLFKYNGMESWNNSGRVQAAVAARDFIIRHAKGVNKHSERYLQELGLTKDDVRVADGKLDLTPAVVDGINRWVDGAMLRPGPSIRPIYMSDPHFMLISDLNHFAYAYQTVIMRRMANEVRHGNYKPAMVLASYVPAIIAADVMRAAITPGAGDNDRFAKWGLSDWLEHGLNRSGITGPGQNVLNAAADIGYRKPLSAAAANLGPTAQQGADLISALASGKPGALEHEAFRALPFASVLWPGKADPPLKDQD